MVILSFYTEHFFFFSSKLFPESSQSGSGVFITLVSSIILLISNISFMLLFNHAGSIFSPRANQQHSSGLFPTVNTCKDLIPLTSPFNFSLRAFFPPSPAAGSEQSFGGCSAPLLPLGCWCKVHRGICCRMLTSWWGFELDFYSSPGVVCLLLGSVTSCCFRLGCDLCSVSMEGTQITRNSGG